MRLAVLRAASLLCQSNGRQTGQFSKNQESNYNTTTRQLQRTRPVAHLSSRLNSPGGFVYKRHKPEETELYKIRNKTIPYSNPIFQRDRLEGVCRSAISLERIKDRADGQIQYECLLTQYED